MLSLSDYKRIINKSRSRNMRFVTIKEDRACRLCKTTLVSGSSVLTINPRRGSRFWVCEGCVSSKLKVVNFANALSLVPFGDEGGYMAMADAYEEAKTNYLARVGAL